MITTLVLGSSVVLAAQGHEVLPGVVTDSDLTTVFFMRNGGGIEAVEVTQGVTLWTSDAADKPLAIDGDRLVAQQNARTAGTLHVVTLDSGDGKRLESVNVSLPAGMTAAIDNSLAGFFKAFAVAEGDDASVLWENLTYITRGRMLKKQGNAVPVGAVGAVRINFPSAQVKSITPGDMPGPISRVPSAAKQAFSRNELVWPPVTVGGLVVSTVHVDVGRTMPALYLARWDAESVFPESSCGFD